jgi:hypothetical protein
MRLAASTRAANARRGGEFQRHRAFERNLVMRAFQGGKSTLRDHPFPELTIGTNYPSSRALLLVVI